MVIWHTLWCAGCLKEERSTAASIGLSTPYSHVGGGLPHYSTSHGSWAIVYSLTMPRAYVALPSHTEGMHTQPCHGWWISDRPVAPVTLVGDGT